MKMYAYALRRAGEETPHPKFLGVDWSDMTEAEARANATNPPANWEATYNEVDLPPELYAKLRGKLGGSSRSAAKQAASRANGLKGGKPKPPAIAPRKAANASREAPASPAPPGKPRAKP